MLESAQVHVLNPNPTVMVCRMGGIWEVSCHESGAFMNELCALMKETPESSLPLLPCEDRESRQLTMNQEVGLRQTLNLPVPLILDIRLPEL